MAEQAGYEYGTIEPTAERVQTARRLLELHRRVFVPEASCNWCLKRWPCEDAGWSMRVLRRAEVERSEQ